METKLIVTCCVLCFIMGMFTAHMIEKDRGCIVTFSKDNVTHVFTGVK